MTFKPKKASEKVAYDNPDDHRRISFIKSCVRMLGYTGLIIGFLTPSTWWLVAGAVVLFVAEGIGIVEETT